MSKRLFLLDAMALVFRAYYALIRNPRITSKGHNTNAQFGFTNTLVELMNNQKPSHMAVCFDTHAPTERHTDFADYKANRQEAPEDLLSALPDIKRIIQGFNIPVIELDGYEADDIIGTLSIQAANAGYEVFMVTPDKDYGQLVSDKIKIYKPGYQGGDVEIMGPEEVCAKWNIKTVDQVIDVLGLMGDAVDNIPGIPGVGEKTAAKLLAEYGTLENILENAADIKGALGEKVRNGKDAAIMSKKLATIITNVPVVFHEADFQLKDWNRELLVEVFTSLEFRSIAQRVLGETIPVAARNGREKGTAGVVQTNLFVDTDAKAVAANTASEKKPAGSETVPLAVLPEGKNIHNTPHTYTAITAEEALKALVQKLLSQPEICFDTETTGLDANDTELVGLSFSWKPGEAYYIPCSPEKEKTLDLLRHFQPLFSKKDITWIGQNIKFDILVLKWYGIEIEGVLFDTMLAHYVIEPDGKRGMDLLSAQYLGYEPVHIEELIGKKGKQQGNMRDVELEKITDYAAEDADITLQLKRALEPELKAKAVEKVFYEVENPLVKVLAAMEFEGV
ncbi:MAG TPA: 5'-3' exonuclease H3TH domain-containing protein, partial [Agriterribacter sp.]|nr:5'-3' exonuclease H3TH domain-containing protein [Agriterribacter sp.]